MAEPATTGTLNEQQVLLSTLPPSPGQQRLALAIVLVLLAAFCATVPFAAVPVGYIREFIPAYATAMFVISSITSALLFVQFSVVHSRALLAVSGGYLFSALITIPWALTFPDLFGATDAAGTTWGVLSRIWVLVFPLSVIGYTLLKDDEATAWPRPLSYFAVLLSAAALLVAADLVTWLATSTNAPTPSRSPFSMLDRAQADWNALLFLLALFALALLWSRRRSVLDLWLMVVMCGLLIELCLVTLVGRRYVVGWYAARVYFLVSSTFVLAVLLSETALLYARLARSVMAQRREREARLMTMDVLSASIAHEMNQPLASIVTNADAASRWMARPTPDLDEVKATLEQIRNSAYRARDLIGSIRAMVKRDDRNRATLDLNDLVREVLALTQRELQRNRVSVEVELDEHLPLVNADRVQLQQVLVNLITNAIDAMAEKRWPRILRVESAVQEPSGVLISVADTGKGIDPKIVDRIFNPLFTTKSNGMGMGLAICRSIIEGHDGRLEVSAGPEGGSVFQFVLPANTAR
ncbi:MAG: MASE4 domain-containing protein [Hyphomicrobiales bacterium]|nr:MASE4 domain-containing protein [Hyphomicrobiales bacterium]